jgi:outer membrane receptor protein involved in Fe transport
MGELSFILMQDGKPLAGQNVVIYKHEQTLLKVGEFVSDTDGYLFTSLQEGKYQLQLVAKNADQAQAFVRKNFVIQAGKESQLILALASDKNVVFEDDETPMVVMQDQNSSVVKEKGFVGLTLTSSEDLKPIGGARVFVKGMNQEFASNKEGYVEAELPEGEHTFSIIHSDFSSQTIQVAVVAKELTSKSVELSPAAMELEEFVVLAPNVEGSVASVMAEEKNSESIASVIGSEQMSKQGDSNAASALKRVAGITLMGGKYIYVRGLGDRYSATELNGMSLPSPNPIKRTVPLDMFPSGVIGSLQVQKSFSPDITGAFGGGYVNIRTKQKSDEDYAKIKVGVSAHGTYGKDITTYQGSDTDWMGSDTTYRAFSNALVSSMTPVIGQRQPSLTQSQSQLQDMTTTRDLNTLSATVPLGTNIGIEASQGFTLGDKHEFHVLANYEYKSEAESRSYTSYDYLISQDGKQTPTPDNTAVNDVYRESIQHGGMLNLSYSYEDFDMRYTKLYVQNTLNQTRSIEGTFGENNSAEKQNYFEWQERTLDIDQINAGLDYTLWLENRLDFGAEMASAKEYVPNDIYYNYKKLSTTSPYVFASRQSELTFTSRSTDDTLFNAYITNKTTFDFLSDEDYIELGATVEAKEREGRVNRLRVQSSISDIDVISGTINDILGYPDTTKLSYDITSRPKDQYDASLDRSALYIKSMLKPMENLEIIFGVRKVDVHQEVHQWALINNVVGTEKNELDFSKNLPALSIKYALDDSNQFKFAYAKTFVFPDFREFVNSEFTHPEFLATIAGNPDLVETDVESIDLQYGYYFNDIDNITASLFYKDMTNPIEDVQTFTTSTLDRYSFDNSASAELSGIELSWYKNLGFLWSSLEDVVFSGNYTYIDSNVVLTPEQKTKFVTQERGLQGLSPEVLNLSMTYQNDDRSLNLAYNMMSERLMRVALKNGDVIYALDDYEVPPELLDFTWIEKFSVDFIDSDATMTFKIKNILDDETVWKQGDLVTFKYKTGRSYSLAFSAKF